MRPILRRIALCASALLPAACAQLPRGAATASPPHYVVFFPKWSADLDPAAEAAVRDAAGWGMRHPWQLADVRGYADPSGSLVGNNAISSLRAEIVADALIAHGVDPARVRAHADGPRLYTADPQESRRAEIVFLGP